VHDRGDRVNGVVDSRTFEEIADDELDAVPGLTALSAQHPDLAAGKAQP
jgi:hypothetical protein